MKKNQLLPIIVAALLFSSCGPNRNSLSQKISKFETEQSSEDEADRKGELADTYLKYVDNFPEDSIARPYLFRAIGVLEELEMYEELVKRSDQFITAYPATYESNLLLYSKAQGLYHLGKHGESIDQMKLFIDKKPRLTSKEMSFLGVVYQDFIQNNPSDSLTPKYQLELANTMSTLGNKEGAVEQFTLFYSTYPKSNGAPYAMMQAADISDKHLSDSATARTILVKLAKMYPENQFGIDAQIILDNGYLGMSGAEVLQDLISKNKSTN
jgi:tetratricopeptide (TPR) repeat protein